MKDIYKFIALPVDDGGCGWYRVRQPFELIKSCTPHDAHVIDGEEDDMLALTQALGIASLVVGRPGAGAGYRELKRFPEFQHLKFVMDIDDNVELISPYSAHYVEYGCAEFYDQNRKQWIWKDGEQGFNLARNRARLAAHIEELRAADLITATTPALAEYARTYNKNVAVLPNAIDLTHYFPPNHKPNKRLRIGYAGGVSHYEDVYTIKEPLNRILREYDCEIVFVGSAFQGLIDEDNKHRMTVRPWVPFKGHPFHLHALALDIMIIPLAELPFNRYKSAVKWYEAAALSIPSVVADVTPYREEITEKTAVPYKTPREFYKGLKGLIENESRRIEIGRAGRSWVEQHRDGRKLANKWVEVYSSLLT